uniref:Uncharacterized protein n=1 Tax=Trichuris muris TaxID=70415 RepID=A0A5S6QEW9_TRIMR
MSYSSKHQMCLQFWDCCSDTCLIASLWKSQNTIYVNCDNCEAAFYSSERIMDKERSERMLKDGFRSTTLVWKPRLLQLSVGATLSEMLTLLPG